MTKSVDLNIAEASLNINDISESNIVEGTEISIRYEFDSDNFNLDKFELIDLSADTVVSSQKETAENSEFEWEYFNYIVKPGLNYLSVKAKSLSDDLFVADTIRFNAKYYNITVSSIDSIAINDINADEVEFTVSLEDDQRLTDSIKVYIDNKLLSIERNVSENEYKYLIDMTTGYSQGSHIFKVQSYLNNNKIVTETKSLVLYFIPITFDKKVVSTGKPKYLRQTSENEYLLLSHDEGSNSVYIKFFNDRGEEITSKARDFKPNGTINVIKETNYGGYILAGSKDNKIWIKKLKSDATDDWENTYSTVNVHVEETDTVIQADITGYEAIDIIETEQNGLVLLANSMITDGNKEKNVITLKLYSNGEVQKSGPASDKVNVLNISIFYPEEDTDVDTDYFYGTGLIYKGNNVFTMTGYYKLTDRDNTDIWIADLEDDLESNFKYHKDMVITYGGSGNDRSYTINENIVAGYSQSANGTDMWVLDYSGFNVNPTWDVTFGTDKDEIAYSVASASDGNYIVAGYTEKNGNKDIYFVNFSGPDNKYKLNWEKMYSEDGDQSVRIIKKTIDNGFILAVEDKGNTRLIKLNSSGNIK